MNKVNREAIKELLEAEDSASLSIYMPTHQSPTVEHISEDKIRLKNLIRSGKEALKKNDIDDGTVSQVTQHIEEEILNNVSFWQHTTEGVAIFCCPAGVQYFHLPVECDEYVHASDGYDIAPLLAIASYDRPYYLLLLATKNPLLLLGDMYGLERVAIDLPKNPIDALNIDELHSNSQTIRSGGHGAGANAHGQGDSKQAGQEERLKFFRLIDDKILSSKNIDTSIPILLAGTDEEMSGYRDSSRMKKLLKSSVSGNFMETAFHEIHARAWPLVLQELGEEERNHQLEKMRNLLGTGRASEDPEAIAGAADEGRVDTLVLGMFATTRDSVKDGNDSIKKLILSDTYMKNKVGRSSRFVFNQGGTIVATTKEALRGGSGMAAIFRY